MILRIILLGFLALSQVVAFSTEFNLNNYQIYNEDQEAIIYYYDYSYYTKDKQDSIHLQLYNIQNVEGVKALMKNQNWDFTTDSLVRKHGVSAKEWSIKAPHNYNYNNLNLGKLKSGYYILEAINGNHIGYCPVIISDNVLMTKSSGRVITSFIADGKTGRSKSGYEVFALMDGEWEEPYRKDRGISRFDPKDGVANNYMPVFAWRNGQIAVTQFYFDYYYTTAQGPQYYVTTNSPAYRPGQDPIIKGYVRIPDGSSYTIASDSARVVVWDPFYEEVYSEWLDLDEFGSFSDTLSISRSSSLGSYQVNVEVPSPYYSYNYDYYSFEVQEYKKPEYDVQLSYEEESYEFGELIKATISAEYFFGAPVSEGEVYYTWYRQRKRANFYNYYYWYYDYYYDYNQEYVNYGYGELNADGTMEISLQLPEAYSENYTYKVVAEVTDESRRTITSSGSVDVIYSNLDMAINLDQYYYEIGDTAVALIQIESTDDQDIYNEIELEILNQSKSILKTSVAPDENGIAEFKFPIEEAGSFTFNVTAFDSKKRKVERSSSVYCFGDDANFYKSWYGYSSQPRIHLKEKQYSAGDSLNMLVYMPKEADLLIELSAKDLIYQEIVPSAEFSNDGANLKSINLVIPPEASGNLNIHVGFVSDYSYTFSNESIFVESQQNKLFVELSYEKEEYEPGDLANATVLITDHQGNPVPNAQVNLATVDNSLLFIYPDLTGDIYSTFYESLEIRNPSPYTNRSSFYSYSSVMNPRTYRIKLGELQKLPSPELLNSEIFNTSISYAEGEEGSISGFLFLKSGKPASNATIIIGAKRFTTDKFGFFELRGFSTEGTTDITFKKNDVSLTLTDFGLSPDYGVHLFAKLPVKGHARKDASYEVYEWAEMDEIFLMEEDVVVESVVIESNRSARGNAQTMEKSLAADQLDLVAGVATNGTYAWDMEETMNGAFDMDGSLKSPPPAPPRVRSNFQDFPFYQDALITNEKGEVTFSYILPDNLTTWRTKAIAVTKDGKVGESNTETLVTQKLLVRLETPRFAIEGDELAFATTVHNFYPEDQKVKISLSAKGITDVSGSKWVNVPSDGSVSIDWRGTIEWRDQVEISVKAEGSLAADAMSVEFPVLPHGIENIESFTAYLNGNDKQSIDINVPNAAKTEGAQVEITMSPSLASGLITSLDDLIGYPYGCVEQTMSRFLPNVVVSSVMQDIPNFEYNIDEAELSKMVDQGFDRLSELQHSDGGWGWWTNDETHPFMTAYVCYGLVLAEEAGIEVNSKLKTSGLNNLYDQLNSQTAKDPATYAYQMMVAMRSGATKHWDEPNKDPETMGPYELSLWIQAASLAGKGRLASEWATILQSKAINEGSWAYWGDQKFYYSWQEDRVETTANAIKALVMADVETDILPKAVLWIMDQRKGKSWHNTRQTAMTVFALSELISDELNTMTDILVKWNGAEVDRFSVSGADMLDSRILTIYPEQLEASLNASVDGEHNLLQMGSNTLEIQQLGKGGLFASARLKYFTSEAVKKDEDQPFTVNRTWYVLNRDENQNTGEYGRTKISSGTAVPTGELILAEVTVEVKSDKSYVLIEDPIPAGCEFVKETEGMRVVGIGEIDSYNQNDYYYWYYSWYTHQEYRDNRMAMTITNLPTGTYTYYYVIRTQIPGEYQVNPTLAQLMYYTEIRGWSDFTSMKILD